ncbi:hypothetical protein KSS87_013478 [Heliosperma pusillum]|nr:hypothetical protein KSS87_013478 [Heliosperma pusillum]
MLLLLKFKFRCTAHFYLRETTTTAMDCSLPGFRRTAGSHLRAPRFTQRPILSYSYNHHHLTASTIARCWRHLDHPTPRRSNDHLHFYSCHCRQPCASILLPYLFQSIPRSRDKIDFNGRDVYRRFCWLVGSRQLDFLGKMKLLLRRRKSTISGGPLLVVVLFKIEYYSAFGTVSKIRRSDYGQDDDDQEDEPQKDG